MSASTSDLGATDEPLLFDAVLRPHRSLPPAGLALLLGILGVVGTAVGIAFYLIGAWPVIGFLGIDLALLALAFSVSNRRARAFETVRLTPSDLTVERVSPAGRRWCWRIQPYWLNVEMDDPPSHDSQVRLRSHGQAVVVGSFLAPGERVDFARALRGALRRLREPRAV